MYYDTQEIKDATYHLLASDDGLCYVGSPNALLAEANDWLEKKAPHYTLHHSQAKMLPYFKELEEYFSGNRRQFQAPAHLIGTPFQQQVWNELTAIDYGKTTTYSNVAHALGKPKSVRAVASAIAKNPVMIIVPCHRVLGKNGTLTGFRGGLALKKQLLLIESSIIDEQ